MAVLDKTMRISSLRNTVRIPFQSSWFTGAIILVLLLAIGGITIDGFLALDNLFTIGALGMLVTLSALGQTFVVISGSGGIDLSVGAVMSFAAIIGAMVISGQDQYLLPGFIVVCLIGAAIGFVNAFGFWFCVFRP